MRVKLYDIAHSRAGDKGNTSNVSLIVYDKSYYDAVAAQVTPARVKAWFGDLVRGDVSRYDLPQLGALNFVMREALGGGVTRTLSLDPHGKTRSSVLLEMEIDLA
ncbi:MAG: AtuA-related protein [Chloroflexota bacterium]